MSKKKTKHVKGNYDLLKTDFSDSYLNQNYILDPTGGALVSSNLKVKPCRIPINA